MHSMSAASAAEIAFLAFLLIPYYLRIFSVFRSPVRLFVRLFVCYPAPCARRSMLDARRARLGALCPALAARSFNARRSLFPARCPASPRPALDARHSPLDAHRARLVARRSPFPARCPAFAAHGSRPFQANDPLILFSLAAGPFNRISTIFNRISTKYAPPFTRFAHHLHNGGIPASPRKPLQLCRQAAIPARCRPKALDRQRYVCYY
jgi:hypothetical protein